MKLIKKYRIFSYVFCIIFSFCLFIGAVLIKLTLSESILVSLVLSASVSLPVFIVEYIVRRNLPEDTSIIKADFLLLQDISQADIPAKSLLKLSLFEEHMELKYLKKTLFLNYGQIFNVVYDGKSEFVNKEKSITARIVAGEVILGDIGAALGAISAVKPKKKLKINKYLIIFYTTSCGEHKLLVFEDPNINKGEKLVRKLKEFCNIQNKPANDSMQYKL